MAVENSQGLTVAWGTVNLGKLVNVEIQSPTVAIEDVTGLTAPTWQYKLPDGTNAHKGVVRRLASGDITPGTASISWIGANDIVPAHVGSAGQFTIIHPTMGKVVDVTAIVLRWNVGFAVGEFVQGSAEFQFLEV